MANIKPLKFSIVAVPLLLDSDSEPQQFLQLGFGWCMLALFLETTTLRLLPGNVFVAIPADISDTGRLVYYESWVRLRTNAKETLSSPWKPRHTTQ